MESTDDGTAYGRMQAHSRYNRGTKRGGGIRDVGRCEYLLAGDSEIVYQQLDPAVNKESKGFAVNRR